MTILRKLALALALAFLGGCTVFRVAYESADSYAHYRAQSYLDLDARGAAELEERIDEFFAWHRKTALPQYARVSEDAARRLRQGLNRDDVAWGYDTLVAHARQSLRIAGERVAPLLDRLSPKQLAHLEKRLAEDNRKFAREHLEGSEAERRKRRAKRLEQRLEDWVGNLSAQQLEKVRAFSDRVPLTAELRDRDRKRMQAEFLEMVRRREAQKRLPDWLAHWERGRDADHRAAAERFREDAATFIVELDRTLTPEQRARAENQLRRYAEDFRILARRNGAE